MVIEVVREKKKKVILVTSRFYERTKFGVFFVKLSVLGCPKDSLYSFSSSHSMHFKCKTWNISFEVTTIYWSSFIDVFSLICGQEYSSSGDKREIWYIRVESGRDTG